MRLVAADLVKRYAGGVLACDRVSFSVEPGAMHALCGENGAGKTSLLKLLYGLQAPDAGRIELDGRGFAPRDPRQAIAAGIGLVPQHPLLVASLSVAENLVLGHEPTRGLRLDRAAARARLLELGTRHGLGTGLDPDAPAQTLTAGQQQQLDILKALHRGARLLLLDEPTALLAPHEAQALFATLAALRRNGLTLVLVTHKLAEVRAACDSFTVLRGGRVVGDGRVDVVSDDELAGMIVGAPAAASAQRSMPATPAATAAARPLRHPAALVQVQGLTLARERGRPALHELSLQLAAGEVLGVAAVEGNGAQELATVLSGAVAPTCGEARIEGRPFTGRGVRAARALGVHALPEDRLHGGLALSMSVADNAVAGRHFQPPFARAGVLRPAAVDAFARELVDRFAIRSANVQLPVATLSGGNMQKLLLGRELTAAPRLLIAAQPTRGVDFGAARALHAALRELQGHGSALLLISADLDEILALADRVIVLFEGRIVAELDSARTDAVEIGRFMTGQQPAQACCLAGAAGLSGAPAAGTSA